MNNNKKSNAKFIIVIAAVVLIVGLIAFKYNKSADRKSTRLNSSH